jgi:hypothetical protein
VELTFDPLQKADQSFSVEIRLSQEKNNAEKYNKYIVSRNMDEVSHRFILKSCLLKQFYGNIFLSIFVSKSMKASSKEENNERIQI